MPELAASVRPRVPKTIEFDAEQFAELEDLRQRARRSNFSDAVRLAVHHGLQFIRQQEAEGKLVA